MNKLGFLGEFEKNTTGIWEEVQARGTDKTNTENTKDVHETGSMFSVV